MSCSRCMVECDGETLRLKKLDVSVKEEVAAPRIRVLLIHSEPMCPCRADGRGVWKPSCGAMRDDAEARAQFTLGAR